MFFLASEGGDKTEQPTPHRLREARRKGQVFKSAELNAAANIVGVMLVLLLSGRAVFSSFSHLFHHFLGKLSSPAAGLENMSALAGEAVSLYLGILAPVFLAALTVGLASNLAQVGFMATPSQLSPQLNRLNPLEGVKKILSARALFELVKSLLKITIVGAVSYAYVSGRLDQMLVLIASEPAGSIQFFWQTLTGLGLRVGLLYACLAVLDYLFQRWEYYKNLRMSRRELKDEHKHLEGDPLVRSRIREKQRHLARQRMLHEVPRADVVITNPTEIAVALRYRTGLEAAPRVVARGVELIAAQIKKIARENNVPVVENPPVARMLWRQVPLGEEIPAELYQAVAEILALIYRLKEQRTAGPT